MNLGVSFAPIVPEYVVWTAFGVAALLAAMLLLARSRGALVRAIALALMVLALANPSITREDRDPIPSVAAVIVDKRPCAPPWSSGSTVFRALKCGSPRPARPTAKPTAPGCSLPSLRPWRMCRPIAWPARS
jgi:hypothetical protein